jgi:DNA-binding response OmpR family regulator
MVNIFIAEDDSDDFLLLKEAIQTILPKFNILHSINGKAFLNSITKGIEADLIFLDLNIPQKNGIDCLIELRKMDKLAAVPIIIYSTSSDFDDIDRCYKNGCTLYLVKPTSFKDLVVQIKKIFFRLGLRREDLQSKDLFVVKKQQDKKDERK